MSTHKRIRVMGLEKIMDECPAVARQKGFPELADDFVNATYLEWAQRTGKNPNTKWNFQFSWSKFYSSIVGTPGPRRANHFASEAAKTAALNWKEDGSGDLFENCDKHLWQQDPTKEDEPVKFPEKVPLNKQELKLLKKTLLFEQKRFKSTVESLKPLKIDWLKI